MTEVSLEKADIVLGLEVSRLARNSTDWHRLLGWRQEQISDITAKLVIYRAFIESDLEVPRYLARPVHDSYFL